MTVRLRKPGWQLVVLAVGAAAALAWGVVLGGVPGLALIVVATLTGGAAELGWRNLRNHEGWAVVVGADALELPLAPVRGRLRDRIPYAQIVELAVSPEVIVLALAAPAATRWIRARDLIDGDLAALGAAIRARMQDARDNPVGGRPPA